MMENSLTNDVIDYIKSHKDETFDIKSLHDVVFSETNYDSFRKIVSRLASRGLVTHLGLSLYHAGKIEDRLKRNYSASYFIDYKDGFYAGLTLLSRLRIVPTPNVFEIKCRVDRGVTCSNVKAIPFGKYGVDKRPGAKDFYCLCELVSLENSVDYFTCEEMTSHYFGFAEIVAEFFKFYGKEIFGKEAPYPRYIYIKVANILKAFNLYDEVLEWYESVQE